MGGSVVAKPPPPTRDALPAAASRRRRRRSTAPPWQRHSLSGSPCHAPMSLHWELRCRRRLPGGSADGAAAAAGWHRPAAPAGGGAMGLLRCDLYCTYRRNCGGLPALPHPPRVRAPTTFPLRLALRRPDRDRPMPQPTVGGRGRKAGAHAACPGTTAKTPNGSVGRWSWR